jgi:arylsulfatase A-like enzyme
MTTPLLLLLASARALPLPSDGPKPPNVLLIVADDLGTDKISSYGESPSSPRTPNIDALAAAGVRFQNAYANPICSPTRAALLTGRYARRTGMGAIVEWDDPYELPLDEVTLPELLELGTPTAATAVGKWHLSGPRTPSSVSHPTLQGFDRYRGAIHNLYFSDGPGKTNFFTYDKVVDGVERRVTEYATAATTDDAIEAAQHMSEPWMLYVAYNAAHKPFHVPPDARLGPNATPVEKYDAMVVEMDRQIGRLLDGLLPGQREHTVVMFMGDNGTDQDAVVAPREGARAKGSLYEGGTNVPFIVSAPTVTQPGAVSKALVHVVDVFPTVAALAGVDPARTGKPIDGVSFANVLADPSVRGPRRFVYTEKFQPSGPPPWGKEFRAVRDERYKLVSSPAGMEFFDLQGRDDDGPPRAPSALTGEERTRFQALKAELDRIEREVRYEY